ncbi:sirohydrochlorin chelatase [Actinoplanes sp. CA-030573]|uniref:sirohydrochlorin chelatase n=1 Tax=Actinoplanes sp. CA-030573 TaxID=3239898 RepID=UPI003D8BF2BE
MVLVAHGSRDPRGAAATEALARAVRRAVPDWDVFATYLDHAGPRPLDVLAALPGRRAVVVPLLLTKAFHGRVDIPAVLTDAADLPVSVALADVLGPVPESASGPVLVPSYGPAGAPSPSFAALAPSPSSAGLAPSPSSAAPLAAPPLAAGLVPSCSFAGLVPSLLIDALVRRLPTAGLDGVVLAAAGTRNAAARTTVEWAAEALSARLSLPCAVGYASAAPPLPGSAVDLLRASGARRIGVASYFLAPGYLYDVAARSALEAGAVAVAEPLTDAPEIVSLVAERVNAVASRLPAAA